MTTIEALKSEIALDRADLAEKLQHLGADVWRMGSRLLEGKLPLRFGAGLIIQDIDKLIERIDTKEKILEMLKKG